MLRSDVEYYRQGALTESWLALEASQQNVAEIHEELARQYQSLIDHAELRPMFHSSFQKRLQRRAF